MSLTDKAYESYYSVSGLVRPFTLAAYLRQRAEADADWERSRPSRLEDLGTASSLSILPLVELYSADDSGSSSGEQPGGRFSTEPGVSYLVTVDGRRILFDVGYNARGEHPSPLLRNMEALGISPADLDAVLISHIHLDHVGGPSAQAARTFALSGEDVDLRGIPAYVPAPMTHPSAAVEVVSEGSRLAQGVASSGPLTRAIWSMGPAVEQALLVNVRDKGVRHDRGLRSSVALAPDRPGRRPHRRSPVRRGRGAAFPGHRLAGGPRAGRTSSAAASCPGSASPAREARAAVELLDRPRRRRWSPSRPTTAATGRSISSPRASVPATAGCWWARRSWWPEPV